MPKRSSKRRHSSTDSGAELDVMKRSVGNSGAARSPSPLSRMPIVVGLPVAMVAPCCAMCSKNRLRENLRAKDQRRAALSGGSALKVCAEHQLNERKS